MGGRRGVLIPSEQRILIKNLVKAACEAGVRQQDACKTIGITARTLQRWRKTKNMIDGRTLTKRIPHNKLSEAERKTILEVVNSSKYGHLPPSQIVPLLADEGRYIASESTIYKILREEKQLRHRLPSTPKKQSKPKALRASAPNEIYSWDITYLSTQVKGLFFYLYLIMDVYSRKIVGWQVYDRECNVHASDVIEEACQRENVIPGNVILHSDNGGPMKGATMLATLQRLGVMPSFSRPSVSNDNPYSESLFKTMKYCPHYPLKPFLGLQEARSWVLNFVNWYNHDHLHSGIKFVTPSQRHNQLDRDILQNRHQIYLRARINNPNRWSRGTRNWDYINEVLLNPERGKNDTINSRQVA